MIKQGWEQCTGKWEDAIDKTEKTLGNALVSKLISKYNFSKKSLKTGMLHG